MRRHRHLGMGVDDGRCDSPILPSPTMPNRTIVVLLGLRNDPQRRCDSCWARASPRCSSPTTRRRWRFQNFVTSLRAIPISFAEPRLPDRTLAFTGIGGIEYKKDERTGAFL
jgi:hypothetical protein